MPTEPTVALAHDYLTQLGGAERVVAAMTEAFPGSPLYTSVYAPEQTYTSFQSVDVRTTWLNRVGPFRRDPRLAFALLAPSFAALDVDADVVLASSSGWAHGIGTDAPVVVYCHAPARWLYQARRYAGDPAKGAAVFRAAQRVASTIGGPPLRRWDHRAARRAARYVVNSRAVADSVRSIYGIDPELLSPPAALDPTGERTPVEGLDEGYVLCVARLLPYKNLDLVIDAVANTLGERLVIVGEGPLRDALHAKAPSSVRFLSARSDAEMRWLYEHAWCLVGAAYEDFGLTPIEAAAFGTPTVALRAGGYLDTIVDQATGILFDGPTSTALVDALVTLKGSSLRTEDILEQAERFSRPRFVARLQDIVSEVARSR